MTIRPAPGRVTPVTHNSARKESDSVDMAAAARLARRRALERAYPLAKQLAEILELEAIEPMATSVKHVRQAIGSELAEHPAMDPHRLDPTDGDALTHHALMLEEELGDGG